MDPDRLDMISQQLTVDNRPTYDIICVSETHIDNTVPDSNIHIPFTIIIEKISMDMVAGHSNHLVAKGRFDLDIDPVDCRLKDSKMLVGT